MLGNKEQILPNRSIRSPSIEALNQSDSARPVRRRTLPTAMEPAGMDSMQAPISSPDGKRHILLIGGGHANVQVLEMLAKSLHKGDKVRITMVSEYQHSYYSGMLPGCVAKFYTDEDIRMDLKALCEYYGATFVQQRVVELCPKRKLVFLHSGDTIPFDVVSINLGSITKGSDMFSNQGPDVILTRPISDLLEKIRTFESGFFTSSSGSSSSTTKIDIWSVGTGAGAQQIAVRDSIDIVVAGGGAAGIELAWGFRARYKHMAKKLNVTVVSAKDVITPAMGRWVKGNVDDKFKEFGMRLIQDVQCVSLEVDKVDGDKDNHVVVLSDGQRLKYDLLTVATGAAAPDCLKKFHFLEKDDGGFLKVTRHLQSAAFPFIFGAGDCVAVDNAPWIAKAGVYAVREGPVLAKNIMAYVRGMKLEEYDPQTGFLALLMTGDGEAISSWKGLSMSNSLMWSLKDKIDRGFMDRFNVRKLPKNPKLDYIK